MQNIYKTIVSIALSVITTAVVAQNNKQSLWQSASENTFGKEGTRYIFPEKYSTITMDVNAVKQHLLTAPSSTALRAANSPVVISLPMPDGSAQQFKIVETHVMHPDLAARYPMIKTYAGQGIDDAAAVARIDITQFGFHAMILSPYGNVFIDPYRHSLTQATDYICYYKHHAKAFENFVCSFDDLDENAVQRNVVTVNPNRTIGDELRDYRLALACTGEYAAFFGGTTAGALAGMVTSVNRVTGVYELELDIRLTLIANTDTLIFLNATTDPYDNNNGATMLGQNQTTCTQRIGGNNYDIGHVFSTGGGGIANLGCVCSSSNKAKGVTGLGSPIGDAFNIDYVAHEMGHQYGGNHTFNSQTSSCSGNRVGSAAYEPGSGVTIMGYAGICGSDNLAQHSIANFHTKSFDEIINFSTMAGGNSCPVVTLTGNNPPVLNPLVNNWNIPYLTPFFLNGSATDLDATDTLTYSWEQWDLGPAGTWNNPSGNAPIFKSYAPSTSGLRLFPKLYNILNDIANGNALSKGELKPSYARVLHFRLTARDNKLNGGGVTYNDTAVAINVVNTVDTFKITYPNVTGISWPALSSQTITWNVANTTAAPISTPNVNIYLSTDGGNTFPITIATNVPNNGSYTCTVPNNQTNTARVWVEGAGNIFFDINNKDFAITAPVGINEITQNDLLNVYPNPGSGNFEIAYTSKANGNVTLTVVNALGQKIKTVSAEKTSDLLRYNLDLTNCPSGIYFVEAILPDGKAVKRISKM